MFRAPHVRLLVSDFSACFRFCHDALGLIVGFGSKDDVYADLRSGDQTLGLFRRDLMAKAVGAAGRPATRKIAPRLSSRRTTWTRPLPK